jgi:ABC-type transport system involved in cytochrome bd biosynthesis fused ATPase/permease subunit
VAYGCSLPENPSRLSHATFFCNHLAKMLQKSIASQENPTHRITCCATIFCNHFAKWLQKLVGTQKTHHACYYLLNHLAKLLQKFIASQKNQHIASHVATIFCNHLAKFMLPKRRFWKMNTRMKCGFLLTFQWFVAKIEYSRP